MEDKVSEVIEAAKAYRSKQKLLNGRIVSNDLVIELKRLIEAVDALEDETGT